LRSTAHSTPSQPLATLEILTIAAEFVLVLPRVVKSAPSSPCSSPRVTPYSRASLRRSWVRLTRGHLRQRVDRTTPFFLRSSSQPSFVYQNYASVLAQHCEKDWFYQLRFELSNLDFTEVEPQLAISTVFRKPPALRSLISSKLMTAPFDLATMLPARSWSSQTHRSSLSRSSNLLSRFT
jgi:hypothetical protein